jgi:hypothetical protein
MAKRKTKGASPRGDQAKAIPLPRLQQVEAWLAAGDSYGAVVAAATKEFGVSVRTAERDIAVVYHRWETEEADERPARRARMRAELWRRYQAAVDVAEDSHHQLSAAKILERLCKMDGLDAPEKVAVHHTGTVTERVAAMTPAESEKRIAELLALRAAAEKSQLQDPTHT